MNQSVLILGLDPGLRHTGWGLVRAAGSRLSFVDAGAIHPPATIPMAERLACLAVALEDLLRRYQPAEAAVEETFVNRNAASALKLGQARGVALLIPARAGICVQEYAANLVKKSVTGYGHADKGQIGAMIRILLPTAPGDLTADAADALAIAICHAHHRGSLRQGMAYDRTA